MKEFKRIEEYADHFLSFGRSQWWTLQ